MPSVKNRPKRQKKAFWIIYIIKTIEFWGINSIIKLDLAFHF